MSARVHHRPVSIKVFAATSAEPGYEASNLGLPQIRRPWRSVGTGVQTIDLDLGQIEASPVLALQGTNVGAFTVTYGSASYISVSLGSLATAEDRHGTRRLSAALPGSVRYVRLVTVGAPVDAAPWFWAGAAYAFRSTTLLPDDPLLGSEANPLYPQTRIDLPNGARVVVDRGAPRQQLSLRFRTERSTDIDTLVRIARSGPCWLDMDMPGSRELQWPVQFDSDTATRTLSRASQDESVIPLYELA